MHPYSAPTSQYADDHRAALRRSAVTWRRIRQVTRTTHQERRAA